MLLFMIACMALIFGYFIYGTLVEKIWGITENKTPAIRHADGVDYIPLPTYKAFLIQFLNIAGLGPVFGAILGAVYGPVCLLWIVFGCIFAGAVHDYLSGMLSLKHEGKSLIYFIENYFGKYLKYVALFLLISMLLLVGAIFAKSPASILGGITHLPTWAWLAAIFGYYFVATLLPIDKLIGRFYPLFALCLIVSSICLIIALFSRDIPPFLNFELTNQHPAGLPLFPLLFVTIACGAISGFHATQSPMIAKCLKDEKYGRPVFYGAMITEGIIALIWATLGISFYPSTKALFETIGRVDTGGVVSEIAQGLLGNIGGIVTIASVVILAITTGDTCFRSARLTLADSLKLPQEKTHWRLILSLCVLTGGILLSIIPVATVWRYFGWFNQTLAMFTLWLVTIYLYRKKKFFWISFLPAVFMTAVSVTYIAYDKLFLGLPVDLSQNIGIIAAIIVFVGFLVLMKVAKKG
ncbi:MAG: carbon starvation protein A [Alphaproteobacteria bacterium]|nr:carbon starvation protein A [Alphaproteobacteria bacterium]